MRPYGWRASKHHRETRMRIRLVAGLLLCGLWSLGRIRAQGADPNLMREVTAVRAEVTRSTAGLHQYTWTEQSDVLVKGNVKSSSAVICRYDGSGAVIKTPVTAGARRDRLSPAEWFSVPRAVGSRPVGPSVYALFSGRGLCGVHLRFCFESVAPSQCRV